jgi:hypothetical protein
VRLNKLDNNPVFLAAYLDCLFPQNQSQASTQVSRMPQEHVFDKNICRDAGPPAGDTEG